MENLYSIQSQAALDQARNTKMIDSVDLMQADSEITNVLDNVFSSLYNQ